MLKCCVCGFQDEDSILRHIRKDHGLSASEYRKKYKEPVRKSWVKSNPDALKAFQEIGRRNKDLMLGRPGHARLKGVWSRNYPCCIECGLTKWKHQGEGLCLQCWNRRGAMRQTDRKNDTLLETGLEGVDFVKCMICQKPFEMITVDHLSLHGLTLVQYKEKFPIAETQSETVSLRRSRAVSAGRMDLKKRRGYLNPQSQRDKKRSEMVLRHANDDFSKVSNVECKVADWFLLHGYHIVIGSDQGPDPLVRWQAPLEENFCVDFLYAPERTVVEVLGDWWHGWKFTQGQEEYSMLHPKVKRNIYLDKMRFEELGAADWKIVKVWEHDVKEGKLDGIMRDHFKVFDPIVGPSAFTLLKDATLKDGPPTELKSEGRGGYNIPLASITSNSLDKWNARWLISQGKVDCKKSMLTEEGAKVLREILSSTKTSLVPQDLVEAETQKAKQEGFPYYQLSTEEAEKVWQGLFSFSPDSTLESHTWAGHGSDLASFFHPHMFECRKRKKMTPLEFFRSDPDLRRGIEKVLCLYGKVTMSNLREICRNEKASSRINNFPPRVAKTVVKMLFSSSTISVLDPCAGFSGRLLGCAACNNVVEYCGIDLSPHTAEGLRRTADFINKMRPDIKVSIMEGDCLGLMDMPKQFDLIMTSPPFLDTEQYKDVPFEHDYEKWMSTFMRPLLERCKERLIPGQGRLALYLDKISGKNFEQDTIELAGQVGLKQEEPVRFRMSYGENNRNSQVSRTVGVLVFSR